MMQKESCALILSALMLTACGGGGGGGGGAPSLVRTTITGTVTPPATTTSGSTYVGTSSMLTPPTSVIQGSAIVQGMDHTFDPAAFAATPSALRIVSLNIKPVDTQNSNYLYIKTGTAYLGDPALGQTTDITNSIGASVFPLSTATGAVRTETFEIAGLPSVRLSNAATGLASAYALPYSATYNPTGFTYQTFGMWVYPSNVTNVVSENYFSAGVVTVPGTMPNAGTATYTGKAAGSYVDAASRDFAYTTATMNATANFATLSVAFATTGTTSLSVNAANGALPTANPGLDMSGTLSYAAGSNTFTGAISTANGMSGNATGRFYGPGIATATATKVAGAPPEIGGTFAVMNSVGGAMQGAFGGK